MRHCLCRRRPHHLANPILLSGLTLNYSPTGIQRPEVRILFLVCKHTDSFRPTIGVHCVGLTHQSTVVQQCCVSCKLCATKNCYCYWGVHFWNISTSKQNTYAKAFTTVLPILSAIVSIRSCVLYFQKTFLSPSPNDFLYFTTTFDTRCTCRKSKKRLFKRLFKFFKSSISERKSRGSVEFGSLSSATKPSTVIIAPILASEGEGSASVLAG